MLRQVCCFQALTHVALGIIIKAICFISMLSAPFDVLSASTILISDCFNELRCLYAIDVIFIQVFHQIWVGSLRFSHGRLRARNIICRERRAFRLKFDGGLILCDCISNFCCLNWTWSARKRSLPSKSSSRSSSQEHGKGSLMERVGARMERGLENMFTSWGTCKLVQNEINGIFK